MMIVKRSTVGALAVWLLLIGSLGVQRAEATPFIGEIRWVAFNYAPQGWAQCDGQLLPINQNQALFALLGTTYGGDGQTTFALPDLRGRAPIHKSSNFLLGQRSGAESHTLALTEIPAHNHSLNADPREATSVSPQNATPAKTGAGAAAYGVNPATAMAVNAVAAVGSNQSHGNMKPFVTMNAIIALQGIFPSQN